MKKGQKDPKASPKTKAMFLLLKFLIQARTRKEIAEFLYISERGVYRYIKTLRGLGFRIYYNDGKYSLKKTNISSIHFAADGSVARVVYLDSSGQQVIRWEQDTWIFQAISRISRRFLPKE